MELFVKVVLIVLGFIAILYAASIATRFIGRKYGNMGYSKYIKVLDRFMITRDGWIYIVQIGEKIFLIGVTNNNMQTLAEFDHSDLIPIEREQKTDFSNLLDKYSINSYFKKGNGEGKDEK